MARGTQHRKRRPPANARVAATPTGKAAKARPRRPEWEQQLFFGRLRTKARWIWFGLAAIFALSFVFLGVGSGSTGISDVISNFFSGTSSSSKSLSSLQKATVKNPKDAAAWLAYANKLQADNQDDQAAFALTTYTTLKPRDQGALLQLAGIYTNRAQAWDTLYSGSTQYTAAMSPSQVLQPKTGTPLANAFATITSPIATAVSTTAGSATANEYQQVITYLSEREGVYKKLVKLSPKDATTQLSLALSASDASDATTAIAAYKAFLKLAPTDSQAPAARKALKALEKQQKAAAKPVTGG